LIANDGNNCQKTIDYNDNLKSNEMNELISKDIKGWHMIWLLFNLSLHNCFHFKKGLKFIIFSVLLDYFSKIDKIFALQSE